MRAIKLSIVVIICMGLVGCASLVAKKPNQVVLLPEDRIFTLPANQTINMTVDGKPISIAFPRDMKVVSSEVLVRQEQRLNDETLKAAKAKTDADKKLTLWGSIMAALAACLGIFFKIKSWNLPKLQANVSVK